MLMLGIWWERIFDRIRPAVAGYNPDCWNVVSVEQHCNTGSTTSHLDVDIMSLSTYNMGYSMSITPYVMGVWTVDHQLQKFKIEISISTVVSCIFMNNVVYKQCETMLYFWRRRHHMSLELVNATTFMIVVRKSRTLILTLVLGKYESCIIAVHLQLFTSLRIQPSIESMLASWSAPILAMLSSKIMHAHASVFHHSIRILLCPKSRIQMPGGRCFELDPD